MTNSTSPRAPLAPSAKPIMRNRPSSTCETWIVNQQECGEGATHCYPAQGGGWHSMCADHAKKHLNTVGTVTLREAQEQSL